MIENIEKTKLFFLPGMNMMHVETTFDHMNSLLAPWNYL